MNKWWGTRRDYETPLKADVLAKVEKWFDVPPVPSSDTGSKDPAAWQLSVPCPAVPAAMTDLHDIITDLVKARFLPDSDGDRPLLYSLLDWTSQVRTDLVDMPKSFESSEALLQCIKDLRHHIETVERDIDMAVRKVVTEAEARAKHLERVARKHADRIKELMHPVDEEKP
jgi:hypothetical protein